jgi:hypothetical protein
MITSTSSPIHCSAVILSINNMQPKILTASWNEDRRQARWGQNISVWRVEGLNHYLLGFLPLLSLPNNFHNYVGVLISLWLVGTSNSPAHNPYSFGRTAPILTPSVDQLLFLLLRPDNPYSRIHAATNRYLYSTANGNSSRHQSQSQGINTGGTAYQS